MNSDRITWAQLEAQRQQEAHEREERARAWAREVSEQLANDHSKFLAEFNEAEQRIFGLIK